MSNNTSGKVSKALQPKNQSSPFGSLSVGKKGVSYTPTYQPGQQDILSAAPQNEANLLKTDIPNATSQYEGATSDYLGNVHNLAADNLVNPQVYNAMYGLQSAPLLTQYHNDMNSLEGNLAAQNLTGGSYDAYSHGLLNQNLGNNLNNAANQSILSGLGATGDYLNWQNAGSTAGGNEVTSLGNLANQYQGLSSGLEQQLMSPMTNFTNYQSTINPLQLAQAQYINSTPTGFQNVMGNIGQGLNSFIPSLGSQLIAAGNIGGNPGANSQFSYGPNLLATVLSGLPGSSAGNQQTMGSGSNLGRQGVINP